MKVCDLFEKDGSVIMSNHILHLLKHIAEEELAGCVIHEVIPVKSNLVHIIADCHDVPRKEGLQTDLTSKLNTRLKLHRLPGFGIMSCEVYHVDSDNFLLTGDK